MRRIRVLIFALPLLVAACTAVDNRGTIAQLRSRQIEIREETLDGGLEKAMESYRRFLEARPDSALAPEAIRRLADLKVEKEYGLLTGDGAGGPIDAPVQAGAGRELPSPAIQRAKEEALVAVPTPGQSESDADFVSRAAATAPVSEQQPASADDLEKAGPLEAIALYRKLLEEYPHYERNDQVLYQMSRAYEELGRIEEAMAVMDRLVLEFPRSRYFDEVQFRRAEYFFTHRRYFDAEAAYGAIVEIGVGSSFFELSLYKLGWTFYKQELYEDAIDRFVSLLDYKVATGYDFEQTEDEPERKRLEDTFRVISLSFSNLGGADAVVDYFSRHGQRSFEDGVYSNLGEFYFDKRRYSDAAASYSAFVSRNPFHKKSPSFHMRVIEIHLAGGFPSLVIAAKKDFAGSYGLASAYWQHFEPDSRPEVLGFLKTNLTDLANHYHALYQDPKEAEAKEANFAEAQHWYREFLASFPAGVESAAINYQLAGLLLEHRSFDQAAVEYEKVAYDYPYHENSSAAGYAAVYAYRQHLAAVPSAKAEPVRREVVRSSLKFADYYFEHEKAPIVLGAAADDLFEMKEYEQAAAAGRQLIGAFPETDPEIRRSAWLVIGHASYELLAFSAAEDAYGEVLALTPEGDKARAALYDNLAASIYKQGEEANRQEDYRGAADHFLRVGRMAPSSKIRPIAEYDGAAALIQLKVWEEAAAVLSAFRENFPGHELQPEVTKKIAYVYREDGKLSQAAGEFERIEQEAKDDEVRRAALLTAAQLYEETGDKAHTLTVYRRYVDAFPQPVELNLETRSKIADLLKENGEREDYLRELREMVAIEAKAGSGRTARTRYLAGTSALVLAELDYGRFVEVRLEKPLEENLRRKQELMKKTTQEFGRLYDYEVGEVTAAASFYLAEIYAHFSKALMTSERPEGLSPLELEQYELAIEEQAYPFEEKSIDIHEKNFRMVTRGIYNPWIEKSLQRLAEFVPARYDKPEAESDPLDSLDRYIYAVARPAPPAAEIAAGEALPELIPAEAAALQEDGESASVEKEAPVADLTPVAEAAPAGGETTIDGEETVPEPRTDEPVATEMPGQSDDAVQAASPKVEKSTL